MLQERTLQHPRAIKHAGPQAGSHAVGRFFTLALLFAAISACSDAIAPISAIDTATSINVDTKNAGDGGQPQMDPVIDWFECTSWDGGYSWNCIYTGTS